MIRFLLLILAGLFLFPSLSSAHQPRIPEGNETRVESPEISKAYYSELRGDPQKYSIISEKPFLLYVNLLVPDIVGQKKDISARIIKDGNTETPVATLDGSGYQWTEMFEPFGYDHYLKGPEYRENVTSGRYDIIVSSTTNDSKYSLAIGEAELFDFAETKNALVLVPQLKKDFFNESPANFIFSPFGSGYIIVMYIFGFLFGFLYRFLLRKASRNTIRTAKKNIGTPDRLVRGLLALALLLWAITTTWSPILLFFSGFTLFEAIFSWCGLYAALGMKSCPIDVGREE